MLIDKVCVCGLEMRFKWNDPAWSFKCKLDHRCTAKVHKIELLCPNCGGKVQLCPDEDD